MNEQESLRYRLRPRTLIRKAIEQIPRRYRYQLYRSLVRLPAEESEGITFKIANKKEELESAFELLHDAYVKTGFMTPHESGLRVTKYHAIPSTSTIVALKDKRAIATLSVIREGPFGFPSDSIVDISHLRQRGVRIAEVSALAIHRDYRQSRGSVLWPLLAYMYRYCIHLFGIDHLVIAVHPSHYDFYEALLFFQKLTTKPVDAYGFANNNPAMCGYLNLREAYKQYSAYFGRSPSNRNLFEFFVERSFYSMKFPKRENFKISDPILTPELLNYFFRERTDAFQTMTSSEIAILHDLYHDQRYRDVLPPTEKGQISEIQKRNDVRHDVRCKGRVVLSEKRMIKLDVRNASYTGFQAFASEEMRFGEPVKANISVAEFNIADLLCQPMWKDQYQTYGFKILESDQSWITFIDRLNRDLDEPLSSPPITMLPKAL